VVEDGVTGFLRPPGEVDAMAEAALSLLTDEDRRRAFGAAGRERAVSRFSQDAVVPRYRAIYQRAGGGS